MCVPAHKKRGSQDWEYWATMNSFREHSGVTWAYSHFTGGNQEFSNKMEGIDRRWIKNVYLSVQLSSDQLVSVSDSSRPHGSQLLGWMGALSITNSRSLLKLISVESVLPSSHLILCRPFLLLPSIFPSIRVFSNESILCIWGGQNIGVSASTSVLPMNTQDWSPLGWPGRISLQSKGLSIVFSNTTAQKHHSSALSFLYSPTRTSIHDYWKNL